MIGLTALSLIGVAGIGASAHCIGMCGGFALAAGRRGISALILYNVGRLFSYAALGAVVGLFGRLLWGLAIVNGMNGLLSVALGVAMILFGLHLLGLLRRRDSEPAGPIWRILKAWGLLPAMKRLGTDAMATLLPPANGTQALTLGMLNGLLPCPVVHAFLPVALATGSLGGSMATLLAVGTGTVPAMLGLGLFGAMSKPGLRYKWLAKAPAVVVLLLGVITVGRIGFIWLHHDMGVI